MITSPASIRTQSQFFWPSIDKFFMPNFFNFSFKCSVIAPTRRVLLPVATTIASAKLLLPVRSISEISTALSSSSDSRISFSVFSVFGIDGIGLTMILSSRFVILHWRLNFIEFVVGSFSNFCSGYRVKATM